MKWQPPIPKGAIVEAQSLGAGLVLLGYCYDIVKAGGLIEISLHEVYPILDTSYASVRRWWSHMQQLGIIERVEDRGRKGSRAYFTAQWIDWRQMRSEISSPVSANNGEMRSEMRSEISSPVSTNHSAYKVLMSTDQAESHGGSEDQDRTERTHPPPVAILFEIFPDATTSDAQSDDLCAISNLALWREVLKTWKTNGYRPRLGNLLNRYDKELARYKGQSNGKHLRSGAGQHSERGVISETDLDAGF